MCYYCFVIFYIGKAFLAFRTSGGIKGLAPTSDLPEDKIARKAAILAKKGAAKIENEVDAANARDAAADLEHNAVQKAIKA